MTGTESLLPPLKYLKGRKNFLPFVDFFSRLFRVNLLGYFDGDLAHWICEIHKGYRIFLNAVFNGNYFKYNKGFRKHNHRVATSSSLSGLTAEKICCKI